MDSKDILLVTFPVDLGNRTLETNLYNIFKSDVDYYRFASQHADSNDKLTYLQSLTYRAKSSLALRNIVSFYSSKGKKVLFHGISPALFSYGSWNSNNIAVTVDWTRSLYPSVLGKPIKRDWVFYMHRKVLRRCPKILCLTDAVKHNLMEIYGISHSSVYKVPMPFYINSLSTPPRSTSSKPKVLFIGGDLDRKGADVLLKWWQHYHNHKCTLTIMSNDYRAHISGVNFLPGIKYGSDIHKKSLIDHDILVLPTRIDGYPQVIGEAAAAGLAVITTKFALGASEVIIDGVSGYISDTPEQCIGYLERLLCEPNLIDSFKRKGYELMQQRFSEKRIRDTYLSILYDI